MRGRARLAGGDKTLASAIAVITIIVSRRGADQSRSYNTRSGTHCGSGQAIIFAGYCGTNHTSCNGTRSSVLIGGLTACKAERSHWQNIE